MKSPARLASSTRLPYFMKPAAAAAALFAIVVTAAAFRGRSGQGPPPAHGWGGSFLHQQADTKLTSLFDRASNQSQLMQCTGELHPELSPQDMGEQASGGAADVDRPLVITGMAHRLPCRQQNGSAAGGLTDACCTQPVSHRLGTTDLQVFQQIFQYHYMRYLYALFPSQPPKYILDAGANAGFSTMLFKLIWPDAVVVSLEPDPSNFAMLQANTKQFEGVHALQAGLWGRAANITVTTKEHGNWGRVFGEAQQGEQGMPAFSVEGVAAKFDIPAFDFVKIDIEGAEGMVFAPGGDFSWISQVKVVSMELHDYFSGYFGLGESDDQPVSRRVEAAFSTTGFSIATDNEHVMYIQPAHLHDVLASQTGSLAQDAAAIDAWAAAKQAATMQSR